MLQDDYEEYHIVDRYKSVSEALKLFKDDPLISRPGSVSSLLFSCFC